MLYDRLIVRLILLLSGGVVDGTIEGGETLFVDRDDGI